MTYIAVAINAGCALGLFFYCAWFYKKNRELIKAYQKLWEYCDRVAERNQWLQNELDMPSEETA